MITFKLDDFVLRNFEGNMLKIFIGDLFEAVSCYFSITFTPPEDDMFLITQEDLKNELNMCLNNPKFLNDTLKMICDKIHANQTDTKIACLKTLDDMIVKN